MKLPLVLIVFAFLLAAAACAAQPLPPIDPPPAPADPAVTLLDRLEARGLQLKNYQASVTYIREQQLLGDRQIRTGAITYQAAQTSPASPAKFAVRFTHLLVNEALREHPRNYIFDGTWLAEVDPENKQFIRRQVVAPGPGSQPYDPLQLGQGPFPLPLGQKREQVLALFTAVLVAPVEDDPADSLHLALTPRVDEKTGKPLSAFTTVNIWYDKTTLLPVKIITEDDSQNTTTVKLKDAKIDQLTAEQAAEAFDTAPPAPGSGWKVEIKPYSADEPEKPAAEG